MFQHPAPMHNGRHMWAGAHRCWHRLSGLPATDQLFHSLPTAPDVLLLPQLISLLVRGFLWMWEHLCFLQVPSNPRGMGPIPLPLFFFSPFFCPTWSSRIFFVLSSVQGLQLTFSWCSVRTFPSVDVFLMHLWREMKLDVLLLLCHLSSSHLQFFIFYFICITLGG